MIKVKGLFAGINECRFSVDIMIEPFPDEYRNNPEEPTAVDTYIYPGSENLPVSKKFLKWLFTEYFRKEITAHIETDYILGIETEEGYLDFINKDFVVEGKQ